MLTFKNFVVTLLLTLAIGLSSWSIMLANYSKKNSVKDDPSKPDAFMNEVVLTHLNKSGLPALKVVSHKMIHYAAKNFTQIAAPEVTIYRQSPEPWHIHSDYATASHGLDEITFFDNVIIQHTADIENPTTSLKTASLTIYPDQQLALTKQTVDFQQPDLTVHAVGMRADLKAGTIKLLAKTEAEYVPTS